MKTVTWTGGALALLAMLVAAAPAVAQPALLELRMPDEGVAPGGVLQAKVESTEPKPITTGGGSYDFAGFDQFLGVAVNSPQGDGAAVAVIRGSRVRVRMLSPTGGLGMEPDYPILSMTVRIPAVPLGTRRTISTGTGLEFVDPGGATYPVSFRSGDVLVEDRPTISNVTPGSGLVSAGGVVVIDGAGFAPSDLVDIAEANVASTRFVSSTRWEVTLAAPFTMHGHRVDVRRSGGGGGGGGGNVTTSYFAYQRTSSLGQSGDDLFRASEPAFPQREHTSTAVAFPALTGAGVHGFAVQNIGAAAASVTLELLTTTGVSVGQVVAPIGVYTQAVRTLAEVFNTPCAAGCYLRVSSSGPVQVLGLTGDRVQDAIAPILPGATVPTPPPPTAPPSMATALNAATYRAGDVHVLSTSIAPGPSALTADVYAVLAMPGGALLSLTPAGLVPGILPLARSVRYPGAVTQELLRVAIPPGLTGSFAWLTALAAPGTLNLLTPIGSTPFVILP